jgi:hypothetical protein
MSNIKTFLKVMSKMGYPNSSVNSIANSINYELDNFLPDLVEEVGEIKADEFVERTLNKLSEDGKGIRVPLSNDKYIYLQIHQSRIDLEETETQVLVDWSFGENKLTGVDGAGHEYDTTMDELYDDIDMGEWGDWDEMIDNIKEECYDYVRDNCGFGIWFDKEY